MNKIQRLIYTITSRLIPQSSARFIYPICKRLVDEFNGENNSNIRTNGEINFLRKHIKNMRVIFDVGANIGEWSQLALSLNRNIDLHCFEPNGQSFNKLINKRFPSKVHRNNFGFGSKREERYLYLFEKNPSMNSLYIRKGINSMGALVQSKKEKILLSTIDNYCAKKKIEHIDFLKIDVEGHELEVLKGARNMLKRGKIKVIQIEYGGCYIDAGIFLKDIFEFFETFDYSFYKLFPKEIRFIKRYDQRLENFQYANYIIIKKGYI